MSARAVTQVLPLLLVKSLLLGPTPPASVQALPGLPTHASLALVPHDLADSDVAAPALSMPVSSLVSAAAPDSDVAAPAPSMPVSSLVSAAAPEPRACAADLPEVDPLELALLAGDALIGRSLTDSALNNTGWQRGPSHARIVSYQKGCADGRCDYCAVSFSSGDPESILAVGDLTPRDFCGAEGIRGGYVWRMRRFFGEPGFADIVQALAPSKCCRVYSTGHSMGSSMAAMFAFCANQQQAAPSRDKVTFAGITNDITLVTFAEDRLSQVPLYSGKPGQCFEGARYVVSDGKLDRSLASSREAQMAGIKVVAQTMRIRSNSAEAETTEQTLARLEAIPQESDEWQEAMDAALTQISPFLTQVGSEITYDAELLNSGDLGWMYSTSAKDAAKLWLNYTMKYKDDLHFTYDVVPGLHPDLKFPNVAFAPLKHPGSSISGQLVPAQDTCSSTAPSLPDYNVLLYHFGNLAYKLEFGKPIPSHELCCYVQALSPNPEVADCGARYFDDPDIECPPTWS